MRRATAVLAILLAMSILSGCSSHRASATTDTKKNVPSRVTLGPYPAGVTVGQGSYKFTLRSVSVMSTRTVSLNQRAKQAPSKPKDLAAPGRRFVDAEIEATKSGKGKMADSLFSSATMMVGTKAVSATGHMETDSGDAQHRTFIFEAEVPNGAQDVVLLLGTRNSDEMISFRLW